MNLEKLEEILKSEPTYRKMQVYQAIFQKLIENWDDATNLPKQLREKFKQEVPLSINAINLKSKDGKTIKALLTFPDEAQIETVLMKYQDHNSVCVSTQVGCQLGCKFCATGKLGFKRNLTYGEIVAQVLYFARLLKAENQRVDSIVFMGMGEPFLNYDNTLKAIYIMNSKDSLNIGVRKISVSTSGIIEGINKLAKEPLDVNLALSLHAPDDALRSSLMPINRKYPLADVLKAIEEYLKLKNRKVMIEYILIGGVNDSDKQALELVKLLQNKKHLYHINLIAYNPTKMFKSSSKERMKSLLEILKSNNISASERFRFGLDIHAACGQLANKVIGYQ